MVIQIIWTAFGFSGILTSGDKYMTKCLEPDSCPNSIAANLCKNCAHKLKEQKEYILNPERGTIISCYDCGRSMSYSEFYSDKHSPCGMSGC